MTSPAHQGGLPGDTPKIKEITWFSYNRYRAILVGYPGKSDVRTDEGLFIGVPQRLSYLTSVDVSKDQLQLDHIQTKDGRVKVTIKPIEHKLSFDKGFYVFIRALQLLAAHNKGTVVVRCMRVGLAGPSGSGKTAFSMKVKNFMPGGYIVHASRHVDIAVISMDNYNDGTKVVDENFDDPRLTDYDLLLENIKDLKKGTSVKIPIYDFKLSKRVGYSELAVPTSRIIIVEGIYALTEKLRKVLDLKVSITGGVHLDLVKRVLRDLDRSGQAADEIITQISDTVYPMYKAFIEPDLKLAQLRIYNTFNPFTGFMNATYTLKAHNTTDTLTIDEVEEVLEGCKRTEESNITDIYLLPPNEDPETCTSWLRMRSRDGRYSLMFEDWVIEGPFVISPRISFEVSVRILGGLMALGYEIGTVLERKTITIADSEVVVKFDEIEKLGSFVQLQGKDRSKLSDLGRKLGLEGRYIPRSYIEQVQLGKLTTELKSNVDLKKQFGLHDVSHLRKYSSFGDIDWSQGSSLPARLSKPSPPIPISQLHDPSGVSKADSNGLLSQCIRGQDSCSNHNFSDEKRSHHQGLSEAQAASLTSSIQSLQAAVDGLPVDYIHEPMKQVEEQLLIIKNQCGLLTRAVEDLNKVVADMNAKQVDGSWALGPSELGLGVGLIGIGLFTGFLLGLGRRQ